MGMSSALTIYNDVFGLRERPFTLLPDPDFLFWSENHTRAYAMLEYGMLTHSPITVITGEIGAGKTTLLRGLLDSLNRDQVVIGNIVTTQLDADDTLRMVAAAFGVRAKEQQKSELLMNLEAYFVSQISQGKRCLLIVDEAQNLSARAVEELRMLSNFQFGNQSLLQTFVVGPGGLTLEVRTVSVTGPPEGCERARAGLCEAVFDGSGGAVDPRPAAR